MIDDNGMQSNGQHAFVQWVYKIRFALTALFFVIVPWQTRWIYRLSPIHPDAEWGRLSLYASEIVLGVLVVWALAHAAWLWRRHAFSKQPLTRERWWVISALVVVVYGVLRSILNYDSAAGLQHSWWLLEAIIVIIFLRIGWFPWRAAVAGFFVGLSLVAVLGIYQAAGQYAPGNKWLGLAEHRPEWGGSSVVENVDGRFLRAYGPFPHPNILGGYMVLGLLLVILRADGHRLEGSRTHNGSLTGFFVPIRSLRSLSGLRMTGYLLTSLFSIALALSFSRSAWIAWVALLVVALVIRRRAVVSRVALSVFTMAVVLVALWPITVTRFDRTARLEARAIEERTTSITDGIAAWKRASWFGYGPAQYMNTFSVQHPDTPWWQLAPPHNAVVALLVDYGVVGALLVLITIVLFVWSLKNYRAAWWLLPLVVLSLFDHYLWSLYGGIILVALYVGFHAHFIHTIPTVSTQTPS